MRRTSSLADALSRALAEVGVSPRRLERWTEEEELGADEELAFSLQVDHYRALAHISRQGVSADVAARRLAATGYICARLRGALLRGVDLPDLGHKPGSAALSGELSDADFAEIVRMADQVLGSTEPVPRFIAKLLAALRGNARRNAVLTDDTVENVVRSSLVNVMCLVVGGELYDAPALAAVLNIRDEPFDDNALAMLNSLPRVTLREIYQAYRDAPLEDIVQIARAMTVEAPKALEHLGVHGATQAEIENYCALFAPQVWCQLRALNDVMSAHHMVTITDVVQPAAIRSGSELAAAARGLSPAPPARRSDEGRLQATVRR